MGELKLSTYTEASPLCSDPLVSVTFFLVLFLASSMAFFSAAFFAAASSFFFKSSASDKAALYSFSNSISNYVSFHVFQKVL